MNNLTIDVIILFPLIVSGLILLTMVGMATMLLLGKGGKYLSGYNFQAKGEKAKKQEKILLRATGILIYVLVPGIAAIGLSVVAGGTWLMWAGFFYSFVVLVVGLILLNTSKKLKKAELLARKYSENPNYEDPNEGE